MLIFNNAIYRFEMVKIFLIQLWNLYVIYVTFWLKKIHNATTKNGLQWLICTSRIILIIQETDIVQCILTSDRGMDRDVERQIVD